MKDASACKILWCPLVGIVLPSLFCPCPCGIEHCFYMKRRTRLYLNTCPLVDRCTSRVNYYSFYFYFWILAGGHLARVLLNRCILDMTRWMSLVHQWTWWRSHCESLVPGAWCKRVKYRWVIIKWNMLENVCGSSSNICLGILVNGIFFLRWNTTTEHSPGSKRPSSVRKAPTIIQLKYEWYSCAGVKPNQALLLLWSMLLRCA